MPIETDPFDTVRPWGHYAPPASASLLRMLVRAGVARGRLTKWIVHTWQRRYGPCVDVEVRGGRYRLDISNNVTDAKLLGSSKRYDGREVDYLLQACSHPGAVFVDIGANTGHYPLSLASHGQARVLAIEPNPAALARLRFNVHANALEDRVIIEAVCVGRRGRVMLSYGAGGLGAASTVISVENGQKLWLESLPLADILQKHGIARIDGLKIDIEGAEAEALPPFFATTASTLWPRLVVIEHCHRALWSVDIIAHMQGLGYRRLETTRSNTVLRLERGAETAAGKGTGAVHGVG